MSEAKTSVTDASVTSQILKAGGLVPLKAKIGKDDSVDTVVARAYAHPVLPGRVVVRLTAENVTAGDDLEMATLGFGEGEDRGAVAKERRRPLGFPGWALVNDPKNARFALDVVDELKKQARKAKSKPGHAKDGIDAIAAKLAKSVPHFLPSFYEEAGRAFIEHGAIPQAAIMFGKAREAEAVHALEVDEQARVDGFLEFALAGAVTTKALSQYAKDLASGHEPKVAYQHFRQLCLQRTLGGMPPWSGMATELRRLAKAAKLDTKAEDASFVSEIIESPALGKAAGDFWRAYEDPITDLGKRNPKIRGALLNLFPTGSTYKPDLDEAWLDLLESTGAVEALFTNDAPFEARTTGSRASWFDRLTAHLCRDYRSKHLPERAFKLLRRMAPMLIADGNPIVACGRYGYQIDLDLAELALTLGVPVALPKAYGQMNLQQWAGTASEPERGLDPQSVAKHPQLGPLLVSSVGGVIGVEPFDSASRNKAGFLAAKRTFVEDVLSRAERAGLPGFEDALGTITGKIKAETFAEMPDLHERFKAIAVAPALARTLQIGAFDEFGWPAMEAVAQRIDPDGSIPWSIHGGLPAVVVTTKTKAIAVGPDRELGEHDLVIPPKHELLTVRFIEGEFLVFLKEGYSTVKAYWSSHANDMFPVEGVSYYSTPTLVPRAAVLADGSWLETSRPIHKGDRTLALGGFHSFDGTTLWNQEWVDGVYKWIETAIATGEKGRKSFPAFIEGGAVDDWKIDNSSYVMPAPAGLTESPLGIRDGLLGMRTRSQHDASNTITKWEIARIDGVSVELKAAYGTALATFPDGSRRILKEESAWREGVTTTIVAEDGSIRGSLFGNKERRYSKSQPVPMQPGMWHLLKPRDVAGSRRLRAVTVEDAQQLIAAVPVQRDAPKGIVPGPLVATAKVLPEITNEKLRAGIDGIVAIAVELGLRQESLIAERAPGAAPVRVELSTGPSDEILSQALDPWLGRTWAADGSMWAQVERTIAGFSADDRSDRTFTNEGASRIEWFFLAIAPDAIGFIATALGTPVAARKPVAELLELFLQLPPPSQLRRFRIDGTIEGDTTERATFEVRWRGGNAYAIRKSGYYGAGATVLEYAPDGVFKDLRGPQMFEPVIGSTRPSAEEVAAVLAAVASGQTSYGEDRAAKLAAATGLTPSQGVYFWAGTPNLTDHSTNFLDKELREELGLKAGQAALARDMIRAIPDGKRLLVAGAAARRGVAALLDGSAVDACIEAFLSIVGKRIAVPEELIAEAEDAVNVNIKPVEAIPIYATAGDTPRLTNDAIFALGADGSVIRASKPEPFVGQTKLETSDVAFDMTILYMHAAYVPFLYTALPVGDELRGNVPAVHELVLARLRNPNLWVDASYRYDGSTIEAALEALGGEPLVGLTEGLVGKKHACAVTVKGQHRVSLVLNPSLIDAKRESFVDQLVTMISGSYVWEPLKAVRSADFKAIVERIGKTPVADGKWEQDPRESAMDTVDAVAKREKISKDAAALYLIYLVQLEPTAKAIAAWTGWKPKQIETLTEELEGKELILAAKRERAGRGYFLPGGWEALKSPHPPFESWKLPFYGKRDVNGNAQPVYGRFAVTAPFHVLYERALARLESGDVPRYEEVKR